ncbi:beta,beta-carotene 15,15'-dioxygenase [Folsomia candida]|uniref:beta,beta-carotene 15,15'-dioxygenase n=1 Tax=Folsomia candida TaxID=158441 RepID=UPI000B8F3DCF|nr:beta,beta-carotene 15,15'-dioxygenase [Folsomia candida]
MSWETHTGAKVDHPFFRHCEQQTETPVRGTIVKGHLPPWLTGVLIRNGPGVQKFGNTSYAHLFDGCSVLHKFKIANGEATYQSRALESEAYQRNTAANRIVVSEFGTHSFPDPCLSILGRLQAKFEAVLGKGNREMEMTDNCSVNVGYYGDQLYAMTETVFIRRVDPESLKCIGDKTRIRDHCALNTATAHPHCFEDGTMLNVGNNFKHKGGPHYCFVKVPPKFNSEETAYKEATIIGSIPSRWKFNPSYFHSFGMTLDKIIFVEAPLCLNIVSMLSSPLWNKSYEECMTWYPNEKARFHVLSMDDGKPVPITYETDAFFTFHHINSYVSDDGAEIICDVAGYNDGEFVKKANVNQLKTDLDAMNGATARRFILPLSIEGAKIDENLVKMKNTTATAVLRPGNVVHLTPHHINKEWAELPRINYSYNGKKYKYTYAIASSEDVMNYTIPSATKISKINVDDGTTKSWLSKGVMVSEPIFVQDPTKPSGAEDDGVVLTTVFHTNPKEVSLVVLNAPDMTELCEIKFEASGTVTSTFHGIWNSN